MENIQDHDAERVKGLIDNYSQLFDNTPSGELKGNFVSNTSVTKVVEQCANFLSTAEIRIKPPTHGGIFWTAIEVNDERIKVAESLLNRGLELILGKESFQTVSERLLNYLREVKENDKASESLTIEISDKEKFVVEFDHELGVGMTKSIKKKVDNYDLQFNPKIKVNYIWNTRRPLDDGMTIKPVLKDLLAN